MTSAPLAWGSALIAFSPILSLFFLFAYQKAQLIILVTTSAFAYLLSTIPSALLWYPFSSSPSARRNALAFVIPGVIFQFFARCIFVSSYHKVEVVIQKSVQRYDRNEEEEDNHDTTEGGGGGERQNTSSESETSKLRLELNDISCGVASGIGFGGMHAIMLYGTLLAAESGSGSVGTLYQPSCTVMPSLVNSAFVTMFFSCLDVCWMLMTFYGMRRRRRPVGWPSSLQQQQQRVGNGGGGGEEGGGLTVSDVLTGSSRGFIGNDRRGGNIVLVLVVLSHMAASFSTVANAMDDGCLLALPLLSGVVFVTVGLFYFGISGHYLPDGQIGRGNSEESGSQQNASENNPNSSGGYHED